MATSMQGQRGLDPRQKHISGHHRYAQFDPEQMKIYGQAKEMAGPESYLSRLAGGDQSLFEDIEAPALRQQSALMGNVASRFSQGGGQGSLSGRRSSGFQNTARENMSDFALQLQAQRQGLQRQAIMDLQGISNSLLQQRPYALQEAAPSRSSGWGGVFGAGLGATGGFFAGGPYGALQGAQTGYNIGSQF